jgi:APA family basic amino acid/polyamine antiporter
MAVVIGESIALGIFLTPAAMAKSLGSPLLLAVVWLVMALMAMCGALCYSELAVRFPKSGGEYVYLREGYGERVGFLYGWMSTIVMYPGVAAALAVGAVPYLAQVVPLNATAAAIVPFAILILFGAINFLGTGLSGWVMSLVNMLKLVVLFALLGWTAVSGHARLSNLQPFTERRPGSEAIFPAIAGGLLSAFFSLGGWWEASKIAGEVRDPKRNLPIAFLGGVTIVTVVYLLISAAFLSVLPIEQLTSNTAFVAQFGSVLFGAAGARVLSICVLLCVCGGIAALSMAAPRVCFAMAQSGSFFPVFGKVNARFGSPANAILLQTGLSLVVLMLGAFDRVLAYVIFSAILMLALTASTLFRSKEPVTGRWYPWAPIIFIALSLVLDLLILMHDPLPALFGVGIVLLGIPLRRFIAPNARVSLLPEKEPV